MVKDGVPIFERYLSDGVADSFLDVALSVLAAAGLPLVVGLWWHPVPALSRDGLSLCLCVGLPPSIATAGHA